MCTNTIPQTKQHLATAAYLKTLVSIEYQYENTSSAQIFDIWFKSDTCCIITNCTSKTQPQLQK